MTTGEERTARVGRLVVLVVLVAGLLGGCTSSTTTAGRAGTTTTQVVADGSTTVGEATGPPTTSGAPDTTAGEPQPNPSSVTRPIGPVDGVPAVPTAPATALVDRLRVAEPGPDLPDYRRSAFGDGWDHDPSTGCNTRELVLIEESLDPPVMGERCKPLAGRWVSRHDGVVTTDPSDLEIDHLVALSDAWRSGAHTWTDARRRTFANDLADPASLIAVTSRSNRSKGDRSPDSWLPPDHSSRCAYVNDWIRVKARWDLTVTPAEKSVLVQVLSGC